jgi:FkbM family methyltransferase
MKRSLTSQVSRIFKYGQKFGIGGALLALKVNSAKAGIVSGKLRNYKHPIYLRNRSSDVHVFGQVIYGREYELKYRLNPSVIVDCGANIGLSSIFYKNKFPEAKIIAIEPEFSNFKILQKNTEKYADIHCINCGIWNRSTNLKISNQDRGNWGFTVEESDENGENTIKAIAIDEIMKQYQLDHIDILKIDIEGSEQKLFESNSEKWLPFVKVIVIEFHDATVQNCAKTFYKALENYDYETRTQGESIVCFINKSASVPM